jgi:phenylalanyl-tRNA synthetase beta chain
MKVPLKWLSEYVGLTLGHAQLAERLTLVGLESAGIRVYGLPVPTGLRIRPEDIGPVWDPKKIVIAQVRSVEKHPNADKLLLVAVDLGTGVPKQIVTGAPNLKVGDRGQKVVLGLTGTMYFDHHGKDKEKQLKELKPMELRGITNDAMVMSNFELGVSDDREGGIIILQDDAPLGKPYVDYAGDIVLELDVLPNMARCLSMLGVAREVAAATGGRMNRQQISLEYSQEPIDGQCGVVIENPKLCARYRAMLIKGIKFGSAPSWMQTRLTYAGMRPINNVVDITNYVMLEYGQPLHAFDYDVLKQRAGGKPPTITVRSARAGEKLKTLDKVDRELTPDHLIIADTAGPIALAGVMGGLETEVSDKTVNVLLESANFDFVSIRKTFRHFDLPSEASARFSRGIHPDIVAPASERAAELLRRHAGGKVCKGHFESYPAPVEFRPISLELEEVRKVLGVSMSRKDVVHVLQALDFDVSDDAPGTLLVRTPGHRLDVRESADLIEELARIHGYDKLPATLLADQLPEQHTNCKLELEERTRDILVAAGLQEVITYSLTKAEREAPLGLSAPEYVTLKNPISPERSVMRQTLLAGVLEAAAENLRNSVDVRLFEVGSVFVPVAGEKLPAEPVRLALVLSGGRWGEFWSEAGAKPPSLEFHDIKGVVETLVGDLHLPDVSYRLAKVAYLHPARGAELLVKGQGMGTFGQLHPRVAEAFGLDGSRVVLAAELDLERITAEVPERYTFTSVPRFPAALRDVAVIVEETIPAEQVLTEIRQAGGDLLRGVRLFDLYRGPSIPAGTKSLAYALSYQAGDRTLTEGDVNKTHKKIEDRLKSALKAQIRGKD